MIPLENYAVEELPYGWRYTAFAFNDEDNNVFEYVNAGDHNIVEEYTIEITVVEEKHVDLNNL